MVFKDVSEEQAAKAKARLSIRLRLSISTLFLAMILPAFAVFATYMYKTNYEIYKKNAADLIVAYNNQAVSEFSALLDPISDSLFSLAKQVQDNPELFEVGKFHETMLLHLENNPNLVSTFTASDQGNFNQVQRMRPNMVIAGRVAPYTAKYNIWNVDRSSAAALVQTKVESVFSIFDEYNQLIDQYAIPNNYDPRQRPFYKALMAKYQELPEESRDRYVLIDEPYISTSTKQPTINVSTPILINGEVRGMVGESFELATIRDFLTGIQISDNSVTYVIDQKGEILVATGPDANTDVDGKTIPKRTLLQSNVAAVTLAAQHRFATGESRFEIQDPLSGAVYLAQFNTFPNSLRSDWQVFTLAPVADFLAGLNEINRKLILFGGIACILLVAITYVLSRTISRPIEILTEEIDGLMDFKTRPSVHSNIREINILSGAVGKLRNTLYAFTSYVPRDLVSDLLRSGNEISLGGESRYLTIMFTDLQGFSSLSEVTPSKVLLKCVSSYLELVTYAVKEESGTVDKFIGDAVMAFWGAPLWDQEHAYHACVAALKSQRRMVQLNEALVAEGLPPLVVRIGIHSDGVLVGNIGSLERMSYTVMGDGVNIASRLEGINKEFDTRTCISHATYKEAGELLWTRPIDAITVKGRKGELTIYELLGVKNGDPEVAVTDRDRELCELTRAAYNLFLGKDYGQAAECYEAIAKNFDDRVAAIMLEKCKGMMGPIIDQVEDLS